MAFFGVVAEVGGHTAFVSVGPVHVGNDGHHGVELADLCGGWQDDLAHCESEDDSGKNAHVKGHDQHHYEVTEHEGKKVDGCAD